MEGGCERRGRQGARRLRPSNDAVADDSSAGESVDVESVREGRDRIIDYYETAMAPFAGVLHFMTNHLVELDGPVARTRSYMHVLNLGMGGLYECRCRRTGAGWRIERLELEERTFGEAADKLRSHMKGISGVEI